MNVIILFFTADCKPRVVFTSQAAGSVRQKDSVSCQALVAGGWGNKQYPIYTSTAVKRLGKIFVK